MDGTLNRGVALNWGVLVLVLLGGRAVLEGGGSGGAGRGLYSWVKPPGVFRAAAGFLTTKRRGEGVYRQRFSV